MNDFDQKLDSWARQRRQSPGGRSSFSEAVMQEITNPSGLKQPFPEPSRLVPGPILALLCLFAGFGKFALILHFAF